MFTLAMMIKYTSCQGPFTGTKASNVCALRIRIAKLCIKHQVYDSQYYMNGKKRKAKSWIVPVSFIETISNWPTKAGNHVPYENESILCECMRCVPLGQRLPASRRGT